MKIKIEKESKYSKNPLKTWEIEIPEDWDNNQITEHAIELARAKPFNKTGWFCTTGGPFPEHKLWFTHYGKKLPRTIRISIIAPERTEQEIEEATQKWFRSLTVSGRKENETRSNREV